jgi:hypothetical protein
MGMVGPVGTRATKVPRSRRRRANSRGVRSVWFIVRANWASATALEASSGRVQSHPRTASPHLPEQRAPQICRGASCTHNG